MMLENNKRKSKWDCLGFAKEKHPLLRLYLNLFVFLHSCYFFLSFSHYYFFLQDPSAQVQFGKESVSGGCSFLNISIIYRVKWGKGEEIRKKEI